MSDETSDGSGEGGQARAPIYSDAEQRKVEGFGDPQYTCDETELRIRHAIYNFFQAKAASGEIEAIRQTQDWQGNTLHVLGSFRPMELAKKVFEAINTETGK